MKHAPIIASLFIALTIITGIILTYHSLTTTYPRVEKTTYTYVKTFPGDFTKTYYKEDYVVVEQYWRPYYPHVTIIGVMFLAIGLYFLLRLIIIHSRKHSDVVDK